MSTVLSSSVLESEVGCLTSGYCVPGSEASGDRPGGGRLPRLPAPRSSPRPHSTRPLRQSWAVGSVPAPSRAAGRWGAVPAAWASRRGQAAARRVRARSSRRGRKFRGPHPLAHSTIVFSFSGSHEWCHSTPQHHSLLLRRPMSVCTCKSAVSSWSCSYTRVSLSPWCARAQSYNRGSRRPRGACAHSRPLPAQPRSLPHAKCASATARKGPDEPQWRLSLRKPRRASHASQAGRRGSLCSQPSPWVQWELLRRCPCCRRPPP